MKHVTDFLIADKHVLNLDKYRIFLWTVLNFM
jgi:hypothetical protein